VMRGEETQVLGWLAGDPARRRGWRVLCLPGTHAKWVAVADGKIARFITAMTGELFALLKTHSVLRSPPTEGELAGEDMTAFSIGVMAAGDGSALASRLFSARGRFLAGELAAGGVESYLSGLLIGAEIGALWEKVRGEGDSVDIIGDAALARLYAHALKLRKITARVTDGEAAALEGLKAIWWEAA
ncbi:MAG TPA: 2-dehydro-3-deoxygalactonokinase, partial [Caulobacteraceae bacterium]